MAQSILSNLPNWIQALAAISIVGLTVATLIVLKNYAAVFAINCNRRNN